MPFPDPSLVPPADRLSPTAGTVVFALAIMALLAWTGALIVRYVRSSSRSDDTPGIAALVSFLLASALVTFVVGDVLALRLLGTEGAGRVTSADGFTVSTRMRGSRVARNTSYVFVSMLDDATGITCEDTTTPAAVQALAADPAMRLPFVHFAGLCQVGTAPSVSRAGAGMLFCVLALGLLASWPKKPALQ